MMISDRTPPDTSNLSAALTCMRGARNTNNNVTPQCREAQPIWLIAISPSNDIFSNILSTK